MTFLGWILSQTPTLGTNKYWPLPYVLTIKGLKIKIYKSHYSFGHKMETNRKAYENLMRRFYLLK